MLKVRRLVATVVSHKVISQISASSCLYGKSLLAFSLNTLEYFRAPPCQSAFLSVLAQLFFHLIHEQCTMERVACFDGTLHRKPRLMSWQTKTISDNTEFGSNGTITTIDISLPLNRIED